MRGPENGLFAFSIRFWRKYVKNEMKETRVVKGALNYLLSAHEYQFQVVCILGGIM